MKHLLKYIPLAIIVAAICAAFVCLVLYENDFLWKAQELNLFLNTSMFFQQQMEFAGGLLVWTASFLTQFFYQPWWGVAILCVWWMVLMLLTKMAFRIPLRWGVLLLVPVALLLLTDVDLGYWIYYLKLRGHFFVATVGLTAAVGLVWLYRLLPPKFFLRPAFIVLTVVVGYPLMGFYGLLAALLMAVLSWRLPDFSVGQKTVSTIVALVCIVGVPLLCYRYVYCQTHIANIYWAALPVYSIVKAFPAYYIPFYLLVAFYVAVALGYHEPNKSKDIKRPLVAFLSQLALMVLLLWGTWHFWYKDYNFHKELAMQRCMESADWEGILAEAADLREEPTRSILMMKNLALSRLGRVGDEMYHFRSGSKASNTPLPVRMTQVVGKAIYYNYGQVNFCYRWCLEDGVEGGWRVEYLKYLTRCALVNGEYQVARKYLNQLKHTLFYRSWAEDQEKFLDHPEVAKADKDYGPVFHMMGYEDVINSDNNLVESFLMKQLVRIDSEDPILQEQTLIAALWMKDIQLFWPKFFQYVNLHPGQHMPVHYQEAAYLYGHLEHDVDISRMPFDDVVVRNYDNFMARAQQNAGMTEDILRDVMRPEFGHTFYYEYFLNRDQQLY